MRLIINAKVNNHKLAYHLGWLLALLLSACSNYMGGGILYNGYRESEIIWLFDTRSLHAIDPTGPNIYPVRLPGELKRAHEAAWSPDGQWIAYSTGGGAAGEPGSDIYVIDRDGEKSFRITSDPVNDSNPAWSPDGKKILYDSKLNGTDYLAVQDITCIADNVACNFRQEFLVEGSHPDWSPDGSNIVYQLGNDSSVVYQISVDEISRSIPLTPEGMDCWFPKWSPDGEKIAVSCWKDNSLYTVSKDGSDFTSLGVQGIRPVWSPDGRKIFFLTSRGENLGKMLGWEMCYTNALFMLDLVGKEVSRLTWEKNECVFWYTLLPSLDK